MKQLHIVAVLVIALSTLTLAQDSDKQTNVAQAVRLLESERVQALLRGDSAFIESNYEDDYITTGANGLVRNKAEVIADLKAGSIRYESMTHTNVKIRFYGNTVVVTGLDSVKAVDKGQDISGQRRFTRVWVKQRGRWRLVSNQTTRIP